MVEEGKRARIVCLAGLILGGCSSGASTASGSREDADTARDDATSGHLKDAARGNLDTRADDDAGKTPAEDTGTPATRDTRDGGSVWIPSSADPVHFHWQLSTTFSAPRDVIPGDGPIVYDIDGEENDAAAVAAIHALGPNVKVICYVDVGTWEDYRSDAASFPASVIGATNGWPGEKWLDVRQESILLPLMKARFEKWCLAKGFDAVEPDNLDAWENSPGFPITESENIAYDLAIATMGHALGLSMGLKNLAENAPSLEPSFDWALDEQCYEYAECSYFKTSFIAKGKAVFDVEYNQAPTCTDASGAHLNAQERDLNLVGPKASGFVYTPCVADTQAAW
jgi:hypothetical protein